jgi:hypothetical protein
LLISQVCPQHHHSEFCAVSHPCVIPDKFTRLPHLTLPLSVVFPVFNHASSPRWRSRVSSISHCKVSSLTSSTTCRRTGRSRSRGRCASGTIWFVFSGIGQTQGRTGRGFQQRGEFILSLDPDYELMPHIAEAAVRFALTHDVCDSFVISSVRCKSSNE